VESSPEIWTDTSSEKKKKSVLDKTDRTEGRGEPEPGNRSLKEGKARLKTATVLAQKNIKRMGRGPTCESKEKTGPARPWLTERVGVRRRAENVRKFADPGSGRPQQPRMVPKRVPGPDGAKGQTLGASPF